MWLWTHFTRSIIVFCKTLLTLPHCRNKTRTHFHLFWLSICCLKETRADEWFSAAALEPKLCHCVMCYGVTNHAQVSPNGWDLALVQSRVLSQSGSLWSGAQHLSVWKASVCVTVDVNVLRLVMLSPVRQGCVGTCVSWARVNSFPLYVNASESEHCTCTCGGRICKSHDCVADLTTFTHTGTFLWLLLKFKAPSEMHKLITLSLFGPDRIMHASR